MMSPEIWLSTAEVRQHAQTVDEVAVMCRETVAGSEYVDMHDEVYGILCSPLFLPIIDPLQDIALQELRNGADATAHLAELLRSLAASIDTTDSAAAQRLNRTR